MTTSLLGDGQGVPSSVVAGLAAGVAIAPGPSGADPPEILRGATSPVRSTAVAAARPLRSEAVGLRPTPSEPRRHGGRPATDGPPLSYPGPRSPSSPWR